MFACEQEDVIPDFLCLAKGLTGGYLPLAATLTTDEVFSAFLGPANAGRTFYHGHTYTGNPLGAAVALANLDLLAAPAGLPALPTKIRQLSRHLERCAACRRSATCDNAACSRVSSWSRTRNQRNHFRANGGLVPKFVGACRVWNSARPLGDVVVVMPPLAIDEPLLDRLGLALYETLKNLE